MNVTIFRHDSTCLHLLGNFTLLFQRLLLSGLLPFAACSSGTHTRPHAFPKLCRQMIAPDSPSSTLSNHPLHFLQQHLALAAQLSLSIRSARACFGHSSSKALPFFRLSTPFGFGFLASPSMLFCLRFAPLRFLILFLEGHSLWLALTRSLFLLSRILCIARRRCVCYQRLAVGMWLGRSRFSFLVQGQ